MEEMFVVCDFLSSICSTYKRKKNNVSERKKKKRKEGEKEGKEKKTEKKREIRKIILIYNIDKKIKNKFGQGGFNAHQTIYYQV
jgi:hypothetical protein